MWWTKRVPDFLEIYLFIDNKVSRVYITTRKGDIPQDYTYHSRGQHYSLYVKANCQDILLFDSMYSELELVNFFCTKTNQIVLKEMYDENKPSWQNWFKKILNIFTSFKWISNIPRLTNY